MKHKTHSNAPKIEGRSTSIKGGTSFLVQIHHAEHQSWQGSVQWLDTGEIIHFRSALELTLLMDQAVQAGKGGAEETRHWQPALQVAK